LEKYGVVELANASSKPNAMVVESHHTVVAVVAVGSAQGSIDIAGLTEFHPVDEPVASHGTVLVDI